MKRALSVFLRLCLGIVLILVCRPRPSFAVGNDNPTGVTGEHNGEITTAGSYDAYTGNAKRTVTKANWDDLDKKGNLKPGHSVKRLSGVVNGKPADEPVYAAPGNKSQRSTGNLTNLTAAFIDFKHQALGVPSLGAEAVNFAPGRP